MAVFVGVSNTCVSQEDAPKQNVSFSVYVCARVCVRVAAEPLIL